MNDITVIIPIKDEILHIERSVRSALQLTPYVFVVDSESTDGSIELAERLGAKVFQYKWTAESNFSKKINWALENLPIETTWVIRLDADEYFMPNAITGLESELGKAANDVYGFTLIRRYHFCGQWIKHGGMYPISFLRVFRVGYVKMEDRWLDEHMDVGEGKVINLPFEIVDDSKITITSWTNKHNSNYSIKEAIELIHQDIGLFNRKEIFLDKKASKKRGMKNKYASMPKYWRCFAYFCFCEFLKLGFLDGKTGFVFNFLHNLWYRLIVDAKVDEIYKACGKDKEKIIKYVMDTYKLDISK